MKAAWELNYTDKARQTNVQMNTSLNKVSEAWASFYKYYTVLWKGPRPTIYMSYYLIRIKLENIENLYLI